MAILFEATTHRHSTPAKMIPFLGPRITPMAHMRPARPLTHCRAPGHHAPLLLLYSTPRPVVYVQTLYTHHGIVVLPLLS